MRLAALTERLAARKPFHGSEIQNLKFERFSTGFRGNHGFRQNEAQRFLRLERFFNPLGRAPLRRLGPSGLEAGRARCWAGTDVAAQKRGKFVFNYLNSNDFPNRTQTKGLVQTDLGTF